MREVPILKVLDETACCGGVIFIVYATRLRGLDYSG